MSAHIEALTATNTRWELLKDLIQGTEQESHKLKDIPVQHEKLQDQALQDKSLHQQGLQSLGNLENHRHELEKALSAAFEIHVSNLLNRAHNILFVGHLGCADNEEACEAAGNTLADVEDLIQQGGEELSDQTLAKKAYMRGFLAEMTGDLETAESSYIQAVEHEPGYRELRRISRLLNPSSRDGSIAQGRALSECGSEASSRASWLFANLKSAAAIPNENGDSFNQYMISQAYSDQQQPLSGKQSSWHQPDTEERHNPDRADTTPALTQPKPPQEVSSRHAIPSMRKLSLPSERRGYSTSFSDISQPDAFTQKPRRLTEAAIRKGLPMIDAGGCPKSPRLPSPLREVSVNDAIVQPA